MDKILKLYCPYEYKLLRPQLKKQICNGCGPKSKFDFVPDTIWGLKIIEICNIHDYLYYIGKTIEDKEKADRIFLNNMLRLIENKTKWKWLKKLRKKRAYKYYKAVKYFGGPAFWINKNNKNYIYKEKK